MSEYFICPNCEARVRAGARACPKCGADEQAGWSTSTDDDLLLPKFGSASDEPDPEDELLRELDGQREGAASQAGWVTWASVGIFVVTILMLVLSRGRLAPLLIPLALIALGTLYFLGQGKVQAPWRERQLYQQLLDRARGDRELVERVIEIERRRNPSGSREQLMQDALYRWNRDNRR